jgi:hypothetical protein
MRTHIPKLEIQRVDQLFDQLSQFHASKRYFHSFLGEKYKEDPKKLWPQKAAAMKAISKALKNMRFATMRDALESIVDIEPEITLLANDAPDYQRAKMREFFAECRRAYSKIHYAEKHPQGVKLVDKRPVKTLPDARQVVMLDKMIW